MNSRRRRFALRPHLELLEDRTAPAAMPKTIVASPDVPKLIVDSAISTLSVTESFAIQDLNVKLDIDHPWDSDLQALLTGPDGTTVQLFDFVGGDGDHFRNTVFNDEAPRAIEDGVAPFTGGYRPFDPLSAFDGLDAQGTWTLEIIDWYTEADDGQLKSWSLRFERPSGLQITGLSDASTLPAALLTITGLGFDPAASPAVRFTAAGGEHLDVPVVDATATSVTVVVPPLMTLGDFDSGPVSVAVVQNTLAGPVVSNVLQGLNVEELPASPLPAGRVTLAYVNGATEEALQQQQAVQHTPFDTMQINRSLSNYLTQLQALSTEIEAIQQEPAHTYAFGRISGNPITISASTLSDVDAMILALLTEQASHAAPLSFAAGGGDSQADMADALLFEIMAGDESTLDATFAQYHAAPRQTTTDAEGASDFALGLIGFGDGLMAGALYGAATIPGAAPAAGSLFLIGSGICVLGVGLSLEDPEIYDYFAEALKPQVDLAAQLLAQTDGAFKKIVRAGKLLGKAWQSGLTPPSPDITVNPTSGLVTSEGGGAASFTVNLTSRPDDVVIIALASSKELEGKVSPAFLVFNPDNWFLNQRVTVTGQDDSVYDGDAGYAIITFPAESNDPDYNGRDAANVGVTNRDNEKVIRLSIEDVSLQEGDGGNIQAIFLVTAEEPNNRPVTFQFQTVNGSALAGEDYAPVGPTSRTIAAGAMGTFITVPIKTDTLPEDPKQELFYVDITTNDPGVVITKPRGVATITDDDEESQPGVIVSPTSGLITSEDGRAATFNVRLDRAPSADVPITITNSNPSAATISPSSFVLNSSNWSTGVTVTVTGLDDVPFNSIGDGLYSVNVRRAGDIVATVALVNKDNDGVQRFQGAYTGSYNGDASGAVAFTVSAAGVITVTVPSPGSGSVNMIGGGAFGGVDGATFTGTFWVDEFGVAHASGNWRYVTPSQTFSGGWSATRPA